MTKLTLIIVAVSYLLGSIPFGYLLVRIFRGQDVPQAGSDNIGATNVARTGSTRLAVATLRLDAAKGYAAVAFGFWMADILRFIFKGPWRFPHRSARAPFAGLKPALSPQRKTLLLHLPIS